MNVDITVTISDVENAADRTLWNVQERKNRFLSELDVDVEASISTLLSHWGLKGKVTVAVS